MSTAQPAGVPSGRGSVAAGALTTNPDGAAPSSPSGPSQRARTGLFLFLAFQGLFLLTASGRVSRIADEYEVYAQCESLWDRGALDIPQVPEAAFFGKVGLDGRRWAPYGPAAAFLALPHHALGRALAFVSGVPRGDVMAWTELVAAITSLATTTWAALAVFGLWRLARALGASEARAATAAALLGGTTFLWPYGTFFFSEPMSAALLVLAVVWHVEGWTLPSAAATWVLLLVKSTNAIFAPALLVLALWPIGVGNGGQSIGVGHGGQSIAVGRQSLVSRALPMASAVLLAGFIHSEWNLARFGAALDPGYDWTGELIVGAPRPFLLSALPVGLVGLLLSPGKSILLFAPPLLLALPRLRAFASVAPAVAACAVVSGASALLVFGSYFYWEGGYAWGPRHLLPVVPLLLAPLALGPAPRRLALAAVVAIGLPLQALGATVSFMEDQAMSVSPRYYALRDDVPRGRPRNVYVLSYCPVLSYPPILLRHLRGEGPDAVGRGLELLPLHLGRVRRNGGAAIPGWVPIAIPLAALALLAGAAWQLRASFHPVPGAFQTATHFP